MARRGSRWRRYRYLNALTWFTILLCVEPFFLEKGEPPLGAFTFICVVLSCIWAAATTKHRIGVLCSLAGLCMLDFVLPGNQNALVKISSTLFFVICTILILKDLWSDEEVDLDTLFGSILGLLLAAGTFAFLFAVIEVLVPGSFQFNDLSKQEKGWEILPFLYFSLTTVTTLGYGDIVPLTPGARNLAGFAAMFGNFYFASLVARLVSRHASGARADRGESLEKNKPSQPMETVES